MLPSNVRHSNQGFTLIEMLVILIIIGILSAISAPSFLGMLNRSKVNSALNEARGALQEAQRESIRKSKTCTVVVPAGNNVALISPTNCLVTGDRQLGGVNTDHSNSVAGSGNWVITFDFKGRTNDVASAGTVVFSLPNNSVPKKCLVVSQGLGLIRTGNYNESATLPECDTSQ